MKKIFTSCIAIVLSALFVGSAWAYDTNDGVGLYLSDIQVSGADGYYYFKTTNGNWWTEGCRTAKWVSINPADVVNGNAIFSAALAARMANQKVVFHGACLTQDGDHFEALKITIKDD